jgi:hypothetical protein
MWKNLKDGCRKIGDEADPLRSATAIAARKFSGIPAKPAFADWKPAHSNTTAALIVEIFFIARPRSVAGRLGQMNFNSALL